MAASRNLSSLVRNVGARGLWLPIVLVVAVATILVEGALHRSEPPAVTEAPEPAPSPTATPFRPELEKVPLMYFSDYWLQLAHRAQGGLLALGRAGVPAVRIRPGYALTTIDNGDLVAAEGPEVGEGQVVSADARVGVALVRLSPEARAEPLPAATSLHAGTLLAVVSLDPERGLQVTPGTLSSTPSDTGGDLDVVFPYPSSMQIGAIVDLDGLLAGVAVRTPDGVRPLSLRGTGALSDRLTAAPVCRGLEVSALDGAARSALRLEGGVLVERVWASAFLVPPDLRPGDILLRWNKAAIKAPEDFAAAYDAASPGSRARFELRRGPRALSGQVEMPSRDGRPLATVPRELDWLGATARWTREGSPAGAGLLVLHVVEGGRAQRAGIAVGDVVTAVGGRPLAWPAARALLGPTPTPAPSVLLVRRGNALRVAVLPRAGGD